MKFLIALLGLVAVVTCTPVGQTFQVQVQPASGGQAGPPAPPPQEIRVIQETVPAPPPQAASGEAKTFEVRVESAPPPPPPSGGGQGGSLLFIIPQNPHH